MSNDLIQLGVERLQVPREAFEDLVADPDDVLGILAEIQSEVVPIVPLIFGGLL